jgi:hypothetical protein
VRALRYPVRWTDLERVVSERLAWGQTLTWPELQGRERTVTLEAPEAARREIARSLGLESLARLTSTLTLRSWLDGVVIDGRLTGVAGRICGLSLDPFDESVDEQVRLRIVPRGSPNAPRDEGGEVVIDLEAEDPPEEAEGPAIDLAAYVLEAFVVALDPFPRKPGAMFVAPEEPAVVSPFAALRGLTERPKRQ